MPESPKKIVYTGESKITPYPVTKETKEAVLDNTLNSIATKTKEGTATKEEVDFYNYNVTLAQNYSKQLDEKLSKADDYSSKVLKLFNDDVNSIKYDFEKIKSNIASPTGISGQEAYYLDQNENAYLNKFNLSKTNFKNEGLKKLSQVNDYIKNKDAASLRKAAEYLLGPTEKTPIASPYGDKYDRVFYNKETFDNSQKKAGDYLLKFARAIELENNLKKFEKYLTPGAPIKSVLENPEIVKNIGRDLYANEIGSELYNPDVRLATEVKLQGKDDNPIDYKASQLAIGALQDLAALNYNSKVAEYTRLKLNAQKIGDPEKLKEAQEGLQAAENSVRAVGNFDTDNYLKTNFKNTYLSIKDDEEQAERRREGLTYFTKGSPFISKVLSVAPVDPVKMYYSLKGAGKSLYNNLVDEAAGFGSIITGNSAENAAIANLQKFDKTGYTIGIDEKGNPVESSRFHWTDPEGRHHFNGYATIESGIPVAHQMLETIGIAYAAEATGGAALGLLGRLGAGALRTTFGAERLAAAGQRLASTGAKLLETPYLGKGLKGIGTAAEKTAEAITNPAVLDRLKTFGSVYATTYPRIYMQEYNNFKKGEDAQNVARWRAAVESLSESIVPNTPDLFKAGAKSLFPFKAASYAKDLSAGLDGVVLGMAPGISNKLLNRVVNSAITKRALGMAGDVFQEGVIEEEASLIGNHFVDQLAKSKNAEYVAQNDLTWKNIMDTAIESVAAMALTAPFMGGGTKRAREQANTEAIISSRWNIANNPEAYKSYIKSQLDKGEITQEQAVQKVAKIDQYAKALENLPIRNLSSIRDMATLLENKDAQYQFFSNHLKKEALLDYTPSEEELPEYTKELERLDGELYKTQQLASKYDSLSLEDKKEIIYNNYKNKYSNIVDRDDVSPIAITAELLRAQKDLTTKKGRIYSKELEGYVNDLGASMDAVKSKFQSFIKNNNEGLTSEQLQYKYELVNVNKDFFAEEEMEDMFDTLGRVAAATYGPLFEIKDENEFIEALARNYVTADTNKRPLTTNDGELLYGQIQEKYVNDYLFNDFIKDLPKEEAAKKNEELKNRFWTRVVELKQDLQKGQVFPGVANTPLTPEQQEAQQAAKAAEIAPKYKDFVDQYRVAAERSLGEEMLDIQEDAANALVKEDNLEGVIAGLASLQSVFIKENFQKIAEDLRAGKTESLVNFLTENGIAPEVIDNLVSKIAPKAEAKPEVKAEITEEKPGEKAETAKEKTKPQIEADLKAKKEEIKKKREAELNSIEGIKKLSRGKTTYGWKTSDGINIFSTEFNGATTEEEVVAIINVRYDKELAKVLQQEVEQLGSMMFDFTPEEQRILTEFGAKVPTETTVSPESLFEPVIEPLTFSPEEQAQNEQAQERQEIEQNVIIEDIRPNYVYLGVTDTSIENKTRLTDQNTAFVFNFIDTIDQSVNSADMRSLGYNMVMHSAREILNRAGLDIQPKETFEEYKEQFKVNGISVLPETQIAEFFKNNNYLDRIKLGIVTDKEGKPLLFDKYGTQTTVGTPVITALGQVFGEGKKLDNAFKASMPTEAVIAPLSKFINGRTIDKKPISVKESNNLIMHVGKEETVVVGEKQYNLKPGVIYLKTDNPQVPYRSTYGRLNTKETAEEIITLIEAYNYSKLNPEAPTLPEYFTAMTPQEFIKYLYNYAFIPKNSSDSPWGITPVTLKGERQPKIVRIFNNKNRDVELEKQEIINLLTSGMPGNKPTRANPTREYFEGDFPFRPFTIKGGKVELGKTINFKAWYADFNKSGARIDGVINRNLAFAKQDVKPLSLPPTSPTDETTVFIETIFTPETIEEIVPEVVESSAITIEKVEEAKLVSDKKAATEKELFSETDSKGRTYTFFSNTKEKEGRITTTFSFNRSDKDLSQRNNATSGIPVEKALGDKYTINEDSIPEGAKVVGVSEIRITEKGAGATVTLENEGQRYQAEVVLNSNTTYDAELAALQPTPVSDKRADIEKAGINNLLVSGLVTSPTTIEKGKQYLLVTFTGYTGIASKFEIVTATGNKREESQVSSGSGVSKNLVDTFINEKGQEITTGGLNKKIVEFPTIDLNNKKEVLTFLLNQAKSGKLLSASKGSGLGRQEFNENKTKIKLGFLNSDFTIGETWVDYDDSNRSQNTKLAKDFLIAKYDAELKALEGKLISDKKADIPLGKVGNTEYEVKANGVYYQGKKLDNPENKTSRQLIEADIERRRQEAYRAIDVMADPTFAKLQSKLTGLKSSYALTPGKRLLDEINDLEIAIEKRGKELAVDIDAKYDAELAALEGKPEVTITEAPGKLPNDIKEEFKGKFIYATPGAGKTTLAQGMQGVIDTDILIVEEMKKRHPDFLAKPGESIQDFILRYVIVNNQKIEINETVYRQIKELTKQGFTVLTGTVELIKYADIVLTTLTDNPRVVNKFKTEEELKKFASKEAEAIKLSGKPTQPLFNNLEGLLTKSGVFEAPTAKDNLPKRRPPLNTGGKITLERGKQYLNSITEAQNKAAKQWFETVAKRVFGEDRFIIEQFLTNPLAWATWSESGIRLFADANFAELYHESWHEFTQHYFTPKQREALYKTASKVYGKLSQQELEEKIAEDFRQFMLTGKMPESIQKYKDARTTFQKIADFLRNLFSNKKTIDRYFERLAKGKIGKRVGKPGFKTLNSTKALSLYDENGKLTPLSYEESKRYLDMVDELFVMLGNSLALEIRQAEIEADPEARRGISYVNTMYNASNIAVVYDEIYNYLADLEEEAIEVGDLVAQQEFSKIFGTANENAKQLFIYHRMNSSLFTEEMTTELDKLNEEDLTDTNLVKDELGTKSQLELAPAIVINLIRSIPKVDSKGQIITNALTDAPEFGDFTENWNILRNTLSGSTTYPEMLTRIEKLADDYPQFNYLLERLPVKITLDSAQELRNKFFNTMSLEKIQGIQGSFTSEGKFNVSYSGTLDVKRVRDQWALRFNTEKGGKFKKPSAVTSNFVLDPSLFEEFPQEPRSPEDVLSFLQAIGFNYSQKAQQAFMEDFNKYRTNVANIYEKLKSATLYSGTEIDNPLKTIMEAHVDKRTRAEVKGKGVDLNKLVEIESKNNLAFANDMIQVADSTQKFITSNPTYQTKIVAALNDSKKYPYFEDLFTDYPELDPSKNWGLENSAYLSYLFDFTQEKLVNGQVKHARNIKEGKPVTLEVVSLDGVTTDGDYLFNKKTIDLNDPEKHLSDIRTLLSRYGRVEENNRIGDKSTTRGLMLSSDEYFLYNKNFYTKDGKFELNPQILNIIYGYLEAEARITTKESVSDNFEKNKFFEGVPQLAYFSEILSPELRTEVFEYFKTNTFEDFENSALKNRVKTAVNTWIHNNARFSQEVLQKFENYKTKEKGTEKTNDLQVSFDELQRYHTLSMISRIEQYKLFNYHPYYYKNAKEVEKRISAPNADGLFPVVDRENLLYTQNSLTTQNVFNNFASQTGIKTLPRKGELEDITYLVIEDERLDSQTAKENKKDYGKHYFNYAETKKKVDVQDAASMFTLDFFRKFYATTKGLTSDMKKELDRQSSIWTNLLAVKLNSKDTAARERLTELLNQTPTYIFSVKKLQYYGPGKAKTEVVPVFHKYANKVLLPSEMVDNEELFNIAVKLHASNADYLVFKTGTKITETVEPVKLYYNGKVDSSAQETGLISLRYLKEQQEIEHKTDALIIFATQFRKLLFKDITEDSEKDLFKQYKNLISLLTSYDKVKFLEKIENPVKAAEFLVEELSKKNISAITKDLIRIKEETKELEYVIDSLIERTMAEGAISSSIKKSIIRQKFNGSQFVQFPVSLVRPDKKLKFYRIEGGEIASAECMIAFSPKYYSLLNLPFDGKSTIGQFDKEGKIINRYEALKRLNQKLADPAFRKTYRASLTMAGVRIPVQGYNSMEKMEIVEFLPEESGKVILVPDELVVKSGGDFDIDKLFMYEPYLKDGKVLNDANSAREELKNLEKLPKARTKEELEKGAALTKLTLQDYMRKTGFVLGDYESIKALAGKKKKLSALAEIEERKILQNKLLDIIVKRLSQKEIFEDLIEPNNVNNIDRLSQDAPEYLKGDRNKIIKEPGTGRDMWTNIINPHYQLYVYQLAHAVEMVGIAAKANTFQTAAQDAELEIIDQDEIDLIYFDVHKTEDGNIKLWEIYDVKGKNKISQIISQIISGSVDVVKNDNILKINITPETVPVALYMNFMGASFDDIVTLVQDELVYNYSKGENLEEILKGFPEYRALISRDKKGRVLEAQTATAILKTSAPEDLFIDDSAKGSLMRLAQYIVLENQQNTYLTPLIVGVDYDTQSFQNFEAVTRKERDIKKVKESDFFNPRAVVKLVTQSPVASFRIDDQFIKKFESLFPISANKEIANFILDAYDDRSVNKKRVDYENYSRRFKNALLTSILETNMPEFKKYADYLKVDPNVPNLEDMASEIKKEAAEYDAYIPLLNDVFFTGNIDSNYIAPGIIKNDKEFDVDVKKEQFNQNLNWDAEGKQQVPEEFRQKVRNFFRIFAYTGIISTQLNKAHGSFLEIIPEQIYTPVVDRFVRETAKDLSKGKQSPYLASFLSRFRVNNPDIYPPYGDERIPNPSLKFYRNYNLNATPQEVLAEYPPLVSKAKVASMTPIVEAPVTSVTPTTSIKAVADIPQNKVSGVESYGFLVTANDAAIKTLGPNPHSIDMIAAGFRTRTTRSSDEMAKYAIKVGDIIKHFGKSADGTTKTIYARVTAIHPKGTPGWKGTWAKEGWRTQDVNVIDRFKDGAAAIEFEIIQTTTPTVTTEVKETQVPEVLVSTEEVIPEDNIETLSLKDQIQIYEIQLLELTYAQRETKDFIPQLIIADNLPKISYESAEKETGGKVGIGKDINYSLLSKTGVNVETAAELIQQDIFNGEQYAEMDLQEIRNYIIDLLRMGKTKFIEYYLPYAAEIESLKEQIASLKEKMATTKKALQLSLFDQSPEKIDQITGENSISLNSSVSQNTPSDQNIIDKANDIQDDDSICLNP